jgi:hypothetical protein
MKCAVLSALVAGAVAQFDGSGSITSQADLDAYLQAMVNGGGSDVGSASIETTGNCAGGVVTDISAYEGCATITGYLHIVGSDLTNLDALSSLEIIEDDPSNPAPGGNGLLIENNDLLDNVDGLYNLRMVAGGITIMDNDILTSTTGLGENLQHVGTNGQGQTLYVSGNDQLADLGASWDFFDGMMPGSLTLEENALLANIMGFHTVQEVTGGVTICNNTALETLAGLEALTMVGADHWGMGVNLCNNLALTNTDAIGGMIHIAGSLEVTNNAAVQALTGFETIMNIGANENHTSIAILNNGQLQTVTIGAQEVTGSVEIENNPQLVLLDMTGLSVIGANDDGESLVVIQNDNIQDLAGLQGLQGALTGAITIAANRNLLSLNGLQQVVSAGADNSGVALAISDNHALETTAGLALQGVLEGAVHIMHNPNLKVLAGLQAISEIQADHNGVALNVYMNNVLENLLGFSGLTGDIEGAVQIESNAALADLEGFSNVESMSELVIAGNENLVSLNGLENVQTFTGEDPTGNSLTVIHNHALEDANALQALAIISGGINIADNPNLHDVHNLITNLESATVVNVHNIVCISTADLAAVQEIATGDVDLEGVSSVTACETADGAMQSLHTNVIGNGDFGDRDATIVGDLEHGHICGGSTSDASSIWNTWDISGSNGLYMDVNTTKCNFQDSHPRYMTSVGGESAHWQLVGVNSIYDASPTGFRVNLWHPTLRGTYLLYFAARYRWKINWMVDTSKRSGMTAPNSGIWNNLEGTNNVIYADVNTENSEFHHADNAAPRYVTSIHGGNNHWKVQGGHAVYSPTTQGFRIFLVYPDDVSQLGSTDNLADFAETNGWSVAYIGSYDGRVSGISSNNWINYQDEGLQITVDTTPGLYTETPAYVTSITGHSHHWMVTGGGAIYEPDTQSFTMYLDRAQDVEFAMQNDWRVNYIAYAAPMDCIVSQWGEFGTQCSHSCGGGLRTRSRTVTTQAYYGGECNYDLEETEECGVEACPVHCEVSAWGGFDSCAVDSVAIDCGVGTMRRTRYIVTHDENGGTPCSDYTLEEINSCDMGPCPIDCDTTEWGSWDTCTKSCGVGKQYAHRSVTQIAFHGGETCPSLTKEQDCNEDACPVDCVQSNWGEWEPCTQTCGFGTKTRFNVRLIEPDLGGVACLGTEFNAADNIWSESASCHESNCPVHCEVGPYEPLNAEDATCSKSCGGGVRHQTREVTQHDFHGGEECPNLVLETQCNVHPCPIDCEVTAWGGWDTCTLSCGTGTQTKTRTVMQEATNGGIECGDDGIALSMDQSCNQQQCPVDCVETAWGFNDAENGIDVDDQGWRQCSTSCGGGQQFRYRSVDTPLKYGGADCAHMSEQQPCNLGVCPVDCEVNNWGDWMPCSAECDTGTQNRTRTISVHNNTVGEVCPDLITERQCNTHDCPVDCVLPGWSDADWHTCSHECGGGLRTRSRTPEVEPENGGEECDATWESETCNTHPCPIDCELSTTWHNEGDCSQTCTEEGGEPGVQLEVLDILVAPEHGGLECGIYERNVTCAEHIPCPIDCEYEDWTDWGTTVPHDNGSCGDDADGTVECYQGCTEECGGGREARSRTITVNHDHGGVECPTDLWQTRACNWHNCPIDCEESSWSTWSTCSKSCTSENGTPGKIYRSRSIITSPAWEGETCGDLEEDEDCNLFEDAPCPIDCVMSGWRQWGSCDTTCGDGTRTRDRDILQGASHGGAECLDEEETQNCKANCNGNVNCFQHDSCPIHCEVGSWSSWDTCTMSCGSGTQGRYRDVEVDADHGGFSCPDTEDSQPCNTHACPIDCEVSEWGTWAAYENGLNEVIRHRTITVDPEHGGDECPDLDETRDWQQVPEADREWQPCTEGMVFGQWSGCTKNCGSGYRYRYREHAICSNQAVVKMHMMYRQGERCNAHACADPADEDVTNEITIPAVENSMFLDEQLNGSWETVADLHAAQLPQGHWQKLAL